MNTAKKTATATHKTVLAGVGAYDSTREKAADTFDHLFVSGSGLVNELLEKGQEVEAKLYAKLEVSKMLKEKFATLKAKLGFGNDRQDQQLDMLNQRVDSLIDVVAKLAQQKAAEQNTAVKAPAKAKPAAKAKAAKAPAKTAAKTATETKASKVPAKAKPAAKAKATKTPAKPASKTKTSKAPAKSAAKPADKTAEKPVTKEAVKSADTTATAKAESKSAAAKE
jgi:hypothetical protein